MYFRLEVQSEYDILLFCHFSPIQKITHITFITHILASKRVYISILYVLIQGQNGPQFQPWSFIVWKAHFMQEYLTAVPTTKQPEPNTQNRNLITRGLFFLQYM